MDSILLVSRSIDLAHGLSGIIHRSIGSVGDLPNRTNLKGVIVDADLASSAELSWIRRAYPTSFIAVYAPQASDKPIIRVDCFKAGANMVAHDMPSLINTLNEAVLPSGTGGGHLSCPYCQLSNLSEREMWFHCPAYHINWPENVPITNICPICNQTVKQPLQVHIHHHHNPLLKSTHQRNQDYLQNCVTQLYNFALVICQHPVTKKFLLCQEFADQGFWCPGGAVDPGESLSVAAVRETIEEAGVEVELKGILNVEYNAVGFDRRSTMNIVRLRVIFYAEPTIRGLSQLPKSCPNFESVGACWCSYDEIQGQIPLRGNEPKRWTKYLADGGPIFPLFLLSEKTANNSQPQQQQEQPKPLLPPNTAVAGHSLSSNQNI